MSNNIYNVEIEHCGDIRTIGDMVKALETNHASYWHWHILLNKFIEVYSTTRSEQKYGVLLPVYPLVNEVSFWGIEAAISQGGYNKITLLKLVEMYEFMLNEQSGKESINSHLQNGKT